MSNGINAVISGIFRKQQFSTGVRDWELGVGMDIYLGRGRGYIFFLTQIFYLFLNIGYFICIYACWICVLSWCMCVNWPGGELNSWQCQDG